MSRNDQLEKLTAAKKLTPDGRDWLKLALDPFHDYNHTVAGYPDSDGSQTLVSCYQYQLDVAAPAGVAGNWDAHIFTVPILESALFSHVTEQAEYGQYSMAAAAPQVSVGPLCVRTGPAGANLKPADPLPANTTYQCLPAVGVEDLQFGVTRILGLGYEVTNTTADMYKQGAVTCYRMPQYRSRESFAVLDRPAYRGGMTVQRHRDAPDTIAEINILKGTRTWAAADGVYAVAAFSDVTNPLIPAGPTLEVLGTSYDHTGVKRALISSHITTGVVNAPPAMTGVVPNVTQTAPMDTTGSYFTGLSNSTTLTIKLKVYIERAPSHTDPQLAVLASPSAGLDTKALEIYSMCISQLPVAVTVAENGLGDWFKKVMSVVRQVAPAVGGVIGAYNPAAGAVIRTAGRVAGNLDTLLSSKDSDRSVTKQDRKAQRQRAVPKKT